MQVGIATLVLSVNFNSCSCAARAMDPRPKNATARSRNFGECGTRKGKCAAFAITLGAVLAARVGAVMHARRLPELQAAWAAPTRALPADDEPPSAFAGSVIKEVGVLHRVLSPVLTEDEMRAVFGRVATSLSARAAELLEALSTRALGEGVDLDKAAHRTRVAAYAAVDARAVCTSLSALPGAEAACAPLEAFGVRGP